jgi:hypothetical protein
VRAEDHAGGTPPGEAVTPAGDEESAVPASASETALEAAADQETSTVGPGPRRTAKRPQNDESLFKATVSDVAKSLKRPAQEVRLIGKLIEEISPPMDTQKTTRYVLAELRNTRSKMPVELVAKVVGLLKDGIPDAETARGGGKK